MKDPQLSSPSFVHNISELSQSEPQHSQPYDATVEDEQTYTLSLRSNEHSTVYPILNLEIDGIGISVAIDTMSGCSYITKRLVKQLRLPIQKRQVPLHVDGFGGTRTDIISTECHVTIDGNLYDFNIIKKICGTLPSVNDDITNQWLWLKNKKLSTNFPRPSTDPQILIGLNHISMLLNEQQEPEQSGKSLKTIFHDSGLAAIDTKYGLIIFGNSSSPSGGPILKKRISDLR